MERKRRNRQEVTGVCIPSLTRLRTWLSEVYFGVLMKKNGKDDQFYESANKTDLRNHTENYDLYIGFPYIFTLWI